MHMCIQMFASRCAREGQKRTLAGILYHSIPLLLRQGLFLNLGLWFLSLRELAVSASLRAGATDAYGDTQLIMWLLGSKLQSSILTIIQQAFLTDESFSSLHLPPLPRPPPQGLM